MNILFSGLGSVGQRHLQNMKAEYGNFSYFAYRTSNSNEVIKDVKLFTVKDISKYYNIKVFSNINDIKEISPDIAFITNPNALHINTAIEFAKMGSHLFIEKPLDSSLDNFDELKSIVEKYNLITFMGYQTRFNPIYDKVKRYLKENKDKIITAKFIWNTYFPHHHNYEDYSKTHTAKSHLGGGVVLSLNHEIDIILDLFGMPYRLVSTGGKISNLDIEAEDTIMSILNYKVNGRNIPIFLNLSFAQTKEIRRIYMQFTDSTLEIDWMKNTLIIYDINGDVSTKYNPKINRNDLFKAEVKYFVDCVKNGKHTFNDLMKGRDTLILTLKIKDAMLFDGWVKC